MPVDEADDVDDGSRFGRRQMLGLLGGAVALAACGGGSPGHATASTGSSAVAEGVGSLEDAAVAVTDRIPEDKLAKWANRFAKSWKAAWKDDAGRTGTADGTLMVNATDFTGTGELTVGDGFLAAGSSIPSARYDVDLTRINYTTADPFHLSSPQFGEVVVTASGFGRVELVCTKIPGHPEIDQLDIRVQAGDTPGTASATYTLTRGGSVTKGAVAASTGDRPQAPDLGAADSVQAFIDGDYAASLVTASDLSTAVGVTVHPPTANGGRANFSPGLNVSNAIAETDDPNFTIQYSICRGTDPTVARAFLDLNKPIATVINGLGDAAYLINAPIFLQVLQGNEVAQITVVAPAGADLAALDQAVAKTLLPKLGRA